MSGWRASNGVGVACGGHIRLFDRLSRTPVGGSGRDGRGQTKTAAVLDVSWGVSCSRGGHGWACFVYFWQNGLLYQLCVCLVVIVVKVGDNERLCLNEARLWFQHECVKSSPLVEGPLVLRRARRLSDVRIRTGRGRSYTGVTKELEPSWARPRCQSGLIQHSLVVVARDCAQCVHAPKITTTREFPVNST